MSVFKRETRNDAVPKVLDLGAVANHHTVCASNRSGVVPQLVGRPVAEIPNRDLKFSENNFAPLRSSAPACQPIQPKGNPIGVSAHNKSATGVWTPGDRGVNQLSFQH